MPRVEKFFKKLWANKKKHKDLIFTNKWRLSLFYMPFVQGLGIKQTTK